MHLLKFHFPFHESDHVLNVAYNPLREGSCLQDIELRRNDEAFLNTLRPPPPRPHHRRRFLSPVQAWAAHDVDLCLRYVQPTGVLGGEVELDILQDSTRLLSWECLVGVPAVLHQPDPCRPGKVPVHQVADAMSVVTPSTSFGHGDTTPAPQRFANHELAAAPFRLYS